VIEVIVWEEEEDDTMIVIHEMEVMILMEIEVEDLVVVVEEWEIVWEIGREEDDTMIDMETVMIVALMVVVHLLQNVPGFNYPNEHYQWKNQHLPKKNHP